MFHPRRAHPLQSHRARMCLLPLQAQALPARLHPLQRVQARMLLLLLQLLNRRRVQIKAPNHLPHPRNQTKRVVAHLNLHQLALSTLMILKAGLILELILEPQPDPLQHRLLPLPKLALKPAFLPSRLAPPIAQLVPARQDNQAPLNRTSPALYPNLPQSVLKPLAPLSSPAHRLSPPLSVLQPLALQPQALPTRPALRSPLT